MKNWNKKDSSSPPSWRHGVFYTLRLFHRFAAVFPKHHVSEILLDDEQKHVFVRIKRRSRTGLYTHRPGSCSITCILLDANRGVRVRITIIVKTLYRRPMPQPSRDVIKVCDNVLPVSVVMYCLDIAFTCPYIVGNVSKYTTNTSTWLLLTKG